MISKYNVELDDKFKADIGQMNYTDEKDEGFLGQDEYLVADKLNELYGKYGLVAKPSNDAISNSVTLTMSGYKGSADFDASKKFSANIYKNKNQDAELENIKDWIKAALTSTGRVRALAKEKGFSGKIEPIETINETIEYGPCIDGQKLDIEAGTKEPC